MSTTSATPLVVPPPDDTPPERPSSDVDPRTPPPVATGTSALAIAAAVFAVIVPPVGLILGIIALRRPDVRAEGGSRTATSAVVIGSILTVTILLIAAYAGGLDSIFTAVVSVIGGLVVSYLIYFSINWLVERTNERWKARLLPYVFIGPVLVLIGVFLIYPTVRTFVLSFTKGGTGNERFVAFDNYTELFSSGNFITILTNNLLWIIVVPALAVIVGLAVATLADRVGPFREKVFKSIVFLPMAISFIAAATVWRFVYAYNPPGQPQVGLLNAVVTGITGSEPIPWLTLDDFKVNSLFLMAVIIWLNAGFAMVLLSAAIKGVPEETIEAARIDGASERQTFFRVVAPQIRATIIAVFITILITVMKIFDIVWAMTGGQYGTSVLGVEFFNQLFSFNAPGKASAVVVILMIAVIPVIIYQVRSYKKQEELR